MSYNASDVEDTCTAQGLRVDAKAARVSGLLIMGPPGRVTALIVIAPFLTFASALAPQHVHSAGPGHDHAIAHSHFGPHEHSVRHDDDVTEIEHDIERVVYLDAAFVHTTAFRIARLLFALPFSHNEICVATRWTVTTADGVAPAHGPPRCGALFRGPPSSLLV